VADKVQNINVNYNIRTVGAEQARQAAVNVQKATETLQQSSQNAGNTISNSYRSANQSMGSMQQTLARLKTQIEVSTNPQRVKQLSDQFKALKTQLDAATKAAFDNAKAIKSIGDNTKSLTQNFGQLYNAVKLAIGAGVAKELANAVLEMARLSGNVEGVERAFNRAFPNSVQTLNELRTATKGAVTDFELMQRTLQATNLGVSVEKLPVLFEFAAARAQQTGESVDYLVDSIVRGIGRKSILVLDNLGLSATRLREQFNGAALASLSVAEATEGVAAIAKVELDKMGGYVETAATQVSQLEANWENLRKTFAKKIDSGAIIQFFNESVQGLEAAFKGREELKKERVDSAAAAQVDRIIQDQAFKALKENQGAQIDLLIQEIAERQRLVRVRESEIQQAEKRKKQIIEGLSFLEDEELATRSLTEMIKAQGVSRDVLSASIPILRRYIEEIRKSREEQVEETGIIERKKEEIEKLNDAIEKTNKLTDLSSRRRVGDLTAQLAVAQAELNELLNGPAAPKIKVNLQKPTTEAVKDFEAQIDPVKVPVDLVPNPVQPIIPKDFQDKLEDAFRDAREELVSGGLDITADLIKSGEEMELASLQNRLNATRNFYNEQQLLAGNNERAKADLRIKEEREVNALQKRLAEKERSVRRFNVIIDTAASVSKTAAQLGFPAALPFIALALAQGAAQLAIVNKTPARFAKGVLNLQGPGTETSDSIPSLLSKGESVMTAKETKRSMGLLDAIKKNKIDDRVLKQLHVSPQGVTVIPWDNKPVVEAIKSQKHPDLARQGRMLYEVHEDVKGNKRYIRSKSI
jgi:hypothetical protein